MKLQGDRWQSCFFVCLCWMGMIGLANLLSAAEPEKRLPNIVLILADDLGYMDIGANNPQTFYETPNINKIATQGMRFAAGYSACTVCSPTRASLMTGRYPTRCGITNYIGGDKKGKLLPPVNAKQLPLEEITLAERLQAAGYQTCFAGKWHLGSGEWFAQSHGFMKGLTENGKAWFPGKEPVPQLNEDGKQTDSITAAAEQFIRAHQSQPFFLYLPYHAPHVPVAARKELVAKYQQKAQSVRENFFLPEGENQVRQVQNHPGYAAMMQQLDEGVGRVLATLDELKLAENTIVVFLSDNGGLATAEGTPTANVPLRAGKGWPYEGGVRIPLFIHAPGKTKPGSVCQTPAMTIDLFPTLLDLAGLPLTRPGDPSLDGVSLVPLLEEKRLSERPLFWHYPHYSNQGGRPHSVIREGNWKLIEQFENNSLELYDLSQDEGEQKNLATQQPERVATMLHTLQAWRTATGAKLPVPNPDWPPAK